MPSAGAELVADKLAIVGRRQGVPELVAHPVAVEAGGRDVRIAVPAAVAARAQMFGGDLEQFGLFSGQAVAAREAFRVA